MKDVGAEQRRCSTPSVEPSSVEPSSRPPRGGYIRRRHVDRKSTRLNSSHLVISYAVFCLKKKKQTAIKRLQEHADQPLGQIHYLPALKYPRVVFELPTEHAGECAAAYPGPAEGDAVTQQQ